MQGALGFTDRWTVANPSLVFRVFFQCVVLLVGSFLLEIFLATEYFVYCESLWYVA